MPCPLRVLVCLEAPWLPHPPRMPDSTPAVIWEVQLPSFPLESHCLPLSLNQKTKVNESVCVYTNACTSVNMPLWFEGLCSLKFLRRREITNVIALDDGTLGEVILENTLL